MPRSIQVSFADHPPWLRSRVMRFRLRAARVALLLAASGCFIFHRGKSDPRPGLDVPAGEIALNVTNHNYLDVVVYVVHDGQQTRVGMVTGSSAAAFFFPARLLGMGREVQLYGRAIGSDSFARTQPLIVQPGAYIERTLQTDLRRSSVGVY